MSGIAFVAALALLLGLIIAGIVWWRRHEQSVKEQLLQAQVLRRGADDLLDALEFLILVDNYTELQERLLDRVTYLYKRYREHLPPTKEAATVDVFDPEPYRQPIRAETSKRDQFRGNRELRMAQRHVNVLLKALIAMHKRREISEAQLVEYSRYLRLEQLQREVQTYADQGDEAAERGDVVTATNYYKGAKKLLIEFELSFPEKNDQIRDFTQRSLDLYEKFYPPAPEEETRNGLPIAQAEKLKST